MSFDVVDLFEMIKDSQNEIDVIHFKKKEYHHCLLYPILMYCIELLNKTKDKEEIKLKVGLYKDNNIYVTVGREMYDLFFTEEKGEIDEQLIDFKYGKNDFLLNSITDKNYKEKKIGENYKELFKISDNIEETETEIDQLIESKKKDIISTFLKGYTNQEHILKALEGKIPGKFIKLPNLIFKKVNDQGKTIEEMDQIYYLNLDSESAQIEGFNFFYYLNYKKGERLEEQIYKKGKLFELKNNNIYFIEIKNSITGLNKEYEKLEGKEIIYSEEKFSSKKSYSTHYKRENLTSIGNTVLTFKIFEDLIKVIQPINDQSNVMFIVNSEFKEDMIHIFKKCLYRDEQIIKELNLTFKFFLIYTQPDLPLKHFIKEKWEKDNCIKNLQIEINKKMQEIEKQGKVYQDKITALEKQVKQLEEKEESNQKLLFNYLAEFSFIKISKEIFNFAKQLSNKKQLITIGILDNINDNHTFKFNSLNILLNNAIENLDKKYFLIDFKTFHMMNFKDFSNISFTEKVLEYYKDKFLLCNFFDEFYILVDFFFLRNLTKIIGSKNYEMVIYLFEEENLFMIYSKKSYLPLYQINIQKNTCNNPMFEKSDNLEISEVEEFGRNYYNLMNSRNIFSKNNDTKYGKAYLFNFKGIINYILDLQINYNSKNDDNSAYAEITNVKKDMNINYDKRISSRLRNIKEKNVIYIRKTEFGIYYAEDHIKSIIEYLYKVKPIYLIDNSYCINNYNKVYVEVGVKKKYNNKYLLNVVGKESKIPLYLELEVGTVDPYSIGLIEYSYFLCLPLLLEKIHEKLNILLLTDDYGILSFYFNKIYKDSVNIASFTQKNEYLNIYKKLHINDNNNIKVKKFKDSINELKNKSKFDLIILEYFEKEKDEDKAIPNTDMIFDMNKIMENNGIFSFNLRADTFLTYKAIISTQKKKYNHIYEINIRKGSNFIICSNEKIQLRKESIEKYHLKNLIGINEFIEDAELIFPSNSN